MALKALLTVDLDRGVSSSDRDKFYDELRDRKWTKLPKLTTTFTATFKDGVTEEAALREIHDDVTAAAKAVGISAYNGAAQVGPHDHIAF